jgi:hypothetical protein
MSFTRFLADRYQFQAFITQRKYLGSIAQPAKQLSQQVKHFCRTFYYTFRQHLTEPPQTGHTAEYFEFKRLATWRNEIRFKNLDIVHTVHRAQ